ncbi:hypothetical protein FRB90_009746 [Tulasnella sp. 427]|nr:hypothetical protein FRB90_009746 [Tulasnella sp. 427]
MNSLSTAPQIVIKAVAVVFEGQHDWMLYVKDDDGSTVKQRQSVVCEELEGVPDWLDEFWEHAENLQVRYREGDAVYARGTSLSVGGSSNGSLNGLRDEADRPRVTGDSQIDDDIDDLFGSDPDEDEAAQPPKRDPQTPESDSVTVPSRRRRSPTSDDSDAFAPPPKRSVFEIRAHRRRREEALGHRHLFAAERLPLNPQPEQSQSPSPIPEPHVLRPISIKARLGLSWTGTPLPPSIPPRRSATVESSASSFRHRSSLLTHDSESGELIQVRWIRDRSATATASPGGSTTTAVGATSAVESPVAMTTRGGINSPETPLNWQAEGETPSRMDTTESPLATTTVQSSTPQGETPQEEQDLPDFEDFEEEESSDAGESRERETSSSARAISELLSDGPDTRRWTPVYVPLALRTALD